MEDKNRFSILLEHLLEVAEVKNYTLAKRLQYDVSYISKWVSGRMLPAKKTEKRVMEGISACVVDEATDDGRNLLLREYSVSIPSDLKAAIYDNLIAEYDYLQEELDSGEARIGPYTDFWAELNMLQYLTKMAHPVLRRVSQLDIVAVMDLMEMAREYRLKVANLQNGQLVDQRSRCISYVLQLCKQREKLEFRLISGRIVNDFQYVADPNMFLSGAASYLRLDNNCPINRIAMVNNSVMEDRLSEYFDQVWNLDDQNVTKERNAIAEHIHHVLQGIHLITRAKSDEMEELQESWMNKI